MSDTCAPIPKPGKTKRRKAKPDETYRLLYRELPCIIPGCEATPTCFCHWPRHRGHGGHNASWAFDEGAPGCAIHHRRMDNQGETWALNQETRAIVAVEAPKFWERMRQEYGL